MKLKKTTKSRKRRGTKYMGYAAKKHKGKGNRGGKGMAGTGKRADQRKTFVHRYLKNYFGKRGMTSRKKIKSKITSLSLRDILSDLKKSNSKKEIILSNKKIIGSFDIKEKISVTAYDISKKARECIEKAGGECNILKKEEIDKKE
jgi:large subunit ribosomal protein L15